MKKERDGKNGSAQGNLVLERKAGEVFFVGSTQITVEKIKGKRAWISIKADKNLRITRDTVNGKAPTSEVQ